MRAVRLGFKFITVVGSLIAIASIAGAADPIAVLEIDLRDPGDGAFLVVDFPLDGGRSVDLELERFRLTGDSTRFVLGRRDGPDRKLDFDPASMTLLRGQVRGLPDSHVVLVIGGPSATSGYIDLGPGDKRYRISSKGRDGQTLAGGKLSVFRATGAPALPPGVALCGIDARSPSLQVPTPSVPTGASGASQGPRMIEIAVETDHEYFQLFDDPGAAAAYLVEVYAEISAIFVRDVNTRLELVFARLWDSPNDIVNGGSPLSEFQSFWESDMTHIERDVAQFFSGRRDFAFGGQAFLSGLCGSTGYSVIGYASGSFPDPSRPSPYHYDIVVAAHELGHSAGTNHTHASPHNIDTCHNPATTPRRGTIMSYCGQTWTGMNANIDLFFHASIVDSMDAHISAVECVSFDCNLNGIDDDSESLVDGNGNGIPDECEDCNSNQTLDPLDISSGDSLDLNTNEIPDDCEPDCNTNNVPDDRDILLGTSVDQHGNGIPDECEVDCNTDSTSDYSEILLDMTLDVDRDAILDACQDCDGNGTSDLDT